MARFQHRRVVRRLQYRETDKQRRRRIVLVELFAFFGIVHVADAEDFFRLLNHRQEGDGAHRHQTRIVEMAAGFRQPVALQQGLEVTVAIAEGDDLNRSSLPP